jgi:hypothetical protein
MLDGDCQGESFRMVDLEVAGIEIGFNHSFGWRFSARVRLAATASES